METVYVIQYKLENDSNWVSIRDLNDQEQEYLNLAGARQSYNHLLNETRRNNPFLLPNSLGKRVFANVVEYRIAIKNKIIQYSHYYSDKV